MIPSSRAAAAAGPEGRVPRAPGLLWAMRTASARRNSWGGRLLGARGSVPAQPRVGSGHGAWHAGNSGAFMAVMAEGWRGAKVCIWHQCWRQRVHGTSDGTHVSQAVKKQSGPCRQRGPLLPRAAASDALQAASGAWWHACMRSVGPHSQELCRKRHVSCRFLPGGFYLYCIAARRPVSRAPAPKGSGQP